VRVDKRLIKIYKEKNIGKICGVYIKISRKEVLYVIIERIYK